MRNLGIVLFVFMISSNGVVHAAIGPPTNLAFGNITMISMNGSFRSNSSASGYIVLRNSDHTPTEVPVDGIVYAGTFGTSVVEYSGTKVTFTSAGLTAGTTYYYAVYSYTGSNTSPNYFTTTSLNKSQITLPPSSVVMACTLITKTSFAANWGSTRGTDSYKLDVASDSLFTLILPAFDNVTVTATTLPITALDAGTTYYVRIYSVNAAGSSTYSNVVAQITIPSEPLANSVATLSNTNFIASWTPVPGASGYQLDVALFSSNYATYVTGFQEKVISGTNTEALVGGLVSGAIYNFRVRAFNAAGVSANSNSRIIIMPGAAVQPLSVTITNFNNGQYAGPVLNVTGQIANAFGVVQATLVYKGITETTSQSKPVTITGTEYTIAFDDSMVDDLGVEFYVSAKDETDSIKVSETKTLYRYFSYANSPLFVSGAFDGTRASIIILSIPLEPKDNLIQSLFFSLGAYDKKGWRLAHFKDGQNVEYQTGINKIERGSGYWFNANGKEIVIKTGEGDVGTYNQKEPFIMSLAAGWNQIGNPFPFNIDWSDVLNDNPTVIGVGGLRVYNGANQNYEASDNLKKNTGGFVFSDKAVTLNVEVTLKGRAGARTGVFQTGMDIGQSDWQVPLRITQNNSTSSLGAIGMHEEASHSKDQWDEIRLPRPDEFLDMTFDHPEFAFRHFAKDILPPAHEQSWKFSVESSGRDEPAELEWNNTSFGANASRLFLLDVENGQFVDMRSTNQYAFTNPGKKEFRIYFRDDGMPVIPDLVIVGEPYPNPSSASVHSALILPESSEPINVEMMVFNLLGQPVKALLNAALAGGIYDVNWDGNDPSGSRVPSGLYLVRAKINGNSMNRVYKVIIK